MKHLLFGNIGAIRTERDSERREVFLVAILALYVAESAAVGEKSFPVLECESTVPANAKARKKAISRRGRSI